MEGLGKGKYLLQVISEDGLFVLISACSQTFPYGFYFDLCAIQVQYFFKACALV